MDKAGTAILAVCILLVGLVGLYATLNAGSAPFAIQMGTMTLWSVLFLLFIVKRAKRGA